MAKEVKDPLLPRKGEETSVPNRTDRVFQKGNYWYFHTREDVRIGPFDSRELAEKGSNDYVGFAVAADPVVLNSLSR